MDVRTAPVEDIEHVRTLWSDAEVDEMVAVPGAPVRLRSLEALAKPDPETGRKVGADPVWLAKLHDLAPGFTVSHRGARFTGVYLGRDEELPQRDARRTWAEELVAKRIPLVPAEA